MKLNLDFEKRYPHPPGKVWQALVSSDALAEWLMPNDFEPQLGRVFRFTYPRSHLDQGVGTVLVEVEHLDPPRRMVWRWRNSDLGANTRVTFLLEAAGDGTLLRLNHAEIPSQQEADSLGGGWPGKLASLMELLGR